MIKKAYLEITNICNLSCSFCHLTKRQPRFMEVGEFESAAKNLRRITEYLYFHLMGEPLLHPKLEELFGISHDLGFKVNITTNGTLLKEKGEILLGADALRKVSISLHCFEVNTIGMSLDEYLSLCFDFCKKAADKGIIAVMRLWNKGGADSLNDGILSKMKDYFGDGWKELNSGYKIREYVFLEWGEFFEWPDENARDFGGGHSCYGLRDQVGVLVDGTVVPCCLDSEGVINLGNIFETDIADILATPRAQALKKSFQNRNITENLCRRCGYAALLRR